MMPSAETERLCARGAEWWNAVLSEAHRCVSADTGRTLFCPGVLFRNCHPGKLPTFGQKRLCRYHPAPQVVLFDYNNFGSQHDLGAAEMSDTPEEPEPGTNADRQDTLVDLGLKLAGLPDELLLQLAETHGNPLALLVSKAHLSKTFCEAARAAQATLTHIDLAIGDGRSTTQWWLRWSQSAPSSRISTFVAAASPTRQWERWPRTASSSRCSICVAAVGSPTRR